MCGTGNEFNIMIWSFVLALVFLTGFLFIKYKYKNKEAEKMKVLKITSLVLFIVFLIVAFLSTAISPDCGPL